VSVGPYVVPARVQGRLHRVGSRQYTTERAGVRPTTKITSGPYGRFTPGCVPVSAAVPALSEPGPAVSSALMTLCQRTNSSIVRMGSGARNNCPAGRRHTTVVRLGGGAHHSCPGPAVVSNSCPGPAVVSNSCPGPEVVSHNCPAARRCIPQLSERSVVQATGALSARIDRTQILRRSICAMSRDLCLAGRTER